MAVQTSVLGTYAFNPYAAGAKTYGAVRNSPNIGPVDKTGYAARDMRNQARKKALSKAMKSKAVGAMSNLNTTGAIG
jgi:hypothetical protein